MDLHCYVLYWARPPCHLCVTQCLVPVVSFLSITVAQTALELSALFFENEFAHMVVNFFCDYFCFGWS